MIVTVAAYVLDFFFFFTKEEIANRSYYIKYFVIKFENRLIFLHSWGLLQAWEHIFLSKIQSVIFIKAETIDFVLFSCVS